MARCSHLLEKSLLPAAPPHYNLIFAYLKAFQFVSFRYLKMVPGNIVDIAGLFVDEVVMPFHIMVKKHGTLLEELCPQQSFFNKQIERVVNRRP